MCKMNSDNKNFLAQNGEPTFLAINSIQSVHFVSGNREPHLAGKSDTQMSWKRTSKQNTFFSAVDVNT